MEKTLGLPVLASEQGKDVDHLILYVHILMVVLFAGWLAYFAYCLLRFSFFWLVLEAWDREDGR